jgi:hypothetical protein
VNSSEFFSLIVKPTAEEYLRERYDIRRGCLAAIVLNQMADYWCKEVVTMTPTGLRKSVCIERPDFSLIWDVADATKHSRLDRGSRTVSDSEQISRPPGMFQAPFGTALFREAIVVNVALDDGSVRALHDAVISVLSM